MLIRGNTSDISRSYNARQELSCLFKCTTPAHQSGSSSDERMVINQPHFFSKVPKEGIIYDRSLARNSSERVKLRLGFSTTMCSITSDTIIENYSSRIIKVLCAVDNILTMKLLTINSRRSTISRENLESLQSMMNSFVEPSVDGINIHTSSFGWTDNASFLYRTSYIIRSTTNLNQLRNNWWIVKSYCQQ